MHGVVADRCFYVEVVTAILAGGDFLLILRHRDS